MSGVDLGSAILLIASTPFLRREWSVSAGLGDVMSNDWPRGWYADEPDQPGAGGQRPQPNFTPAGPQGGRDRRPPDRDWYAPGGPDGGGGCARGASWPSWRGWSR